MKKNVLLMTCILILVMASSVLAEIALQGGNNMEEALILQNDYFSNEIVNTYDGNREESWYAFYVPEDGECVIRVKSYKGLVCNFKLLNNNGERLEKEFFDSNEAWKQYIFNAKQGEIYYLCFERNVPWAEWAYIFSVCTENRHSMDEQNRVIREATCKQEGLVARNCKLCGKQIVVGRIPAKGHQPGVESMIKEANCLSRGLNGVRCAVCQEVISSTEVPVTEHVPGKYVDVRLSTCTAEGFRVQYCQTCNTTMNTETVLPLGHVPKEWIKVQAETCTSTGLREKRCAVCSEILAVEELPMKGHQYSEWETSVAPTKENEGKQIRFCTYCGEEQTESIPKIEKFMGLF